MEIIDRRAAVGECQVHAARAGIGLLVQPQHRPAVGAEAAARRIGDMAERHQRRTIEAGARREVFDPQTDMVVHDWNLLEWRLQPTDDASAVLGKSCGRRAMPGGTCAAASSGEHTYELQS